MLPAKYSVVVIHLICWMVNLCLSAPPPYAEPIIYVTLTRWENRTFSPRLFYVTMMVRHNQHSNSNQVQEPYTYESPLPSKLDEHQLRPFFSVRNSFHKKVQEESPSLASSSPTSFSSDRASEKSSAPSTKTTTITASERNITIPTLELIVPSQNDSEESFDLNDTLKIHTLGNFPRNHADRITFEVNHDETRSDVLEEEMIVFKDNALSNRRTSPVYSPVLHKFNQASVQEESQHYKRSCSRSLPQHYYQGKSPRAVNVHDKIPVLDLALRIVHSNKGHNGAENQIFSPFSISNVLALLLLGSSQTTHQELSRLLKIDPDTPGSETPWRNLNSQQVSHESKFHEAFYDLLNMIKYCSNPKVVLESANEIFADSNFPLLKSYETDASKYYGAQAQEFDFRSDSDVFQQNVNSWVREKTKGKIQSIIDSPPSPLTTLALVNAIYFQGSWEVPFAPQVTREGKFHVNSKTNITVKLMTNVMTIPYLKTEDYQMIRLAYKGNDTAMYIILPTTEGTRALLDLEQRLKPESLEENMRQMREGEPTSVAVKIPKMRVESDGHLKEILSHLGVQSIFNVSSANFSRISETPGLHVSSLLHRAIVDVNEKGSEASAVSVATGDRNLDDVPIPFVANRPFLFFIYNNAVDTILFYGRVFRPQPLEDH